MRLTWLGHSSFKLEAASGSLVFDPYMPDYVPGLALPPNLEADAVVCSHGHSDHDYARAVRLSGRKPGFSLLRVETFHDNAGGSIRGGNTVTLVDDEGIRLLHLGDLGHGLSREQLAELGRVDVLLIPVGGYYTIDAAVAAEQVRALRPRIVVPMHFRGPGFGFGVIAEVDAFLAAFDNVRRFDANVIELAPDGDSYTAALRCPLAGQYQGEV